MKSIRYSLHRSGTKYQNLLSEIKTRGYKTGAIQLIEIKKQYNTSPVADYLS